MRNWFIKFKISKYGVSSWVTQVGSNISSNISSRSFAARKKNKKLKNYPNAKSGIASGDWTKEQVKLFSSTYMEMGNNLT